MKQLNVDMFSNGYDTGTNMIFLNNINELPLNEYNCCKINRIKVQ